MRSRLLRVVLVATPVFFLTGCRQGDGPLPPADSNAQEDMKDIARGLTYIAEGYEPAVAPKESADDLRKYATPGNVVPAVDELSRCTSQAIAKRNLPVETAQRLSRTLWLTVESHDLSERQIEGLQNDAQSLLMSIGVAEPEAQQVAAQVGEVQKIVTTRTRRWYEWF